MSFLRKQESRLVPAEAGIQKYERLLSRKVWIPASAGMTIFLYPPAREQAPQE